MSSTESTKDNKPVDKEEEDYPRLPTWKYLWQLALFRPWAILASVVLTALIFSVGFQVIGLIMRAFFDTLTGDAPASVGVWGLSALVVATAVARTGIMAWFKKPSCGPRAP